MGIEGLRLRHELHTRTDTRSILVGKALVSLGYREGLKPLARICLPLEKTRSTAPSGRVRARPGRDSRW